MMSWVSDNAQYTRLTLWDISPKSIAHIVHMKHTHNCLNVGTKIYSLCHLPLAYSPSDTYWSDSLVGLDTWPPFRNIWAKVLEE